MSHELSESQNMAIGAIAAFSQSMILHPTIYWKNAAQQGLPFTLNPRFLYRGLKASLVNETGQMGSHFAMGGFLKKTFGTSISGEMASAVLAGLIISPFVQCCEVTMIQQQRNGGTLLGTPLRIAREYGVRSFSRGYTPMIAREVLWTTGMLGTTPLMQKWLMQEKGWGLHAAEFSSSMANGLAVGVLSCPMDAMSVCMKGDLGKEKYSGFFSAFRTRLAAGPKVFFGGVMWRSLNVAGVILICNAVRYRLEPLAIDYNTGKISPSLDLPAEQHRQHVPSKVLNTNVVHCEEEKNRRE